MEAVKNERTPFYLRVTILPEAGDLFSPATFTLLLLFFFGGLKQFIISTKIGRVHFAQVLANFELSSGWRECSP